MSATADETARCPECGAPIAPPGTCRDNFHALLALEWEVPGGAGGVAHFYAVSAYALQHPDSMQLTAGALRGLRAAVEDALSETADVRGLRARARRGAERAHVTRRDGEPVPSWPVSSWPMNVADVVEAGVDGYADRVKEWARSVVSELDGARA
jgi:hypothetical protein